MAFSLSSRAAALVAASLFLLAAITVVAASADDASSPPPPVAFAFLDGRLPPAVVDGIRRGYAYLPPLTVRNSLYGFLAYFVLMVVYRINEKKKAIPPPPLKGWDEHNAEAQRVHAQFQTYLQTREPGKAVSINRSKGGHSDSNRTNAADYKKRAIKVDVSSLDQVIAIDKKKMLMHIEPGLPMDEMARVAIAHGVVPYVVLEFPGITAGGALCGGGIESSSHKYGGFFDTIEEVDVITGDGVLRKNVSRTNLPDLFHSLGTSYGTMGILTRLAVKVEPAPKYVHVRYIHTDGMEGATAAMQGLADEGVHTPDFVDGVAMSPTSAMVVVGDGCDNPPAGVRYVSLRNNRNDPWFFWHLTSLSRRMRALTNKKPTNARGGWRADAGEQEYMTLDDYLFRFDRGAFWMARHGLHVFYGRHAYNPSPRATAGPSFILRCKYAWLATTRQLYRMLHAIDEGVLARTYIVQDYIMPGAAEACQLSQYTNGNAIGIWPLWICPVRMVGPRQPTNAGFGFPVQKTRPDGLMFNVGVYGLPNEGKPFDPVVLNKALENEASRLEGRKMLYAQSFYTKDEFWSLFDKKGYEAVRDKYKSTDVFPDIATKLLLSPSKLQAYGGVVPVSFLNCAGAMALWYFSLWQEVLYPRFLHARNNIRYTGMTRYMPVTDKDEGKKAK